MLILAEYQTLDFGNIGSNSLLPSDLYFCRDQATAHCEGKRTCKPQSLLPSLNSSDEELWVELMQQLPTFSSRRERCATIKIWMANSVAWSMARLWDSWQHLKLHLCSCVHGPGSMLPQLRKPQAATGACLNLFKFINVIQGHVFPSCPFSSPPTTCSCFSIHTVLRNTMLKSLYSTTALLKSNLINFHTL